jgi:hypothetical protein
MSEEIKKQIDVKRITPNVYNFKVSRFAEIKLVTGDIIQEKVDAIASSMAGQSI